MDDFRDDGTRVCPIHGLRFDPDMSNGCIKCGRPSQLPPKKRSKAPSKPPASEIPPSFKGATRPPSYAPLPRRNVMTPGIPFDPMNLPDQPFSPAPMGQGIGQSVPLGGPISIMAAPERKQSRRGLLMGLGLVTLAASGAAAWFLSPEGATDWKKKIVSFRYGPAAAHTGAIFVPSGETDAPRPLLVLLDHRRHPVDVCLRYARHCEEHGWIAISCDALGGGVEGTDGAEAAAIVEEARTRAKVDAARAVVQGFGVAGQVALRLALVQPELFGGAILECTDTGPWRDVGALAQNDVSFFLFVRSSDGNHEKMVTMKDEMERKGLRVTWDEIPGGHDPMERDELDPAFAWLEGMRG